MEKQTSDEYTSRLKCYDKLVLGDPTLLENTIACMSNPQLIEFYEYCVEKTEDEGEKCELYWYASLFLEETSVVKMYINGQLYVQTTLGNGDVPMVDENALSVEDLIQINETITLLEQRKKEKNSFVKKLLRNLRGR